MGQFSYQRGAESKGQASGAGKRNQHFFEGKFSNLIFLRESSVTWGEGCPEGQHLGEQ